MYLLSFYLFTRGTYGAIIAAAGPVAAAGEDGVYRVWDGGGGFLRILI